MKTTGVLPLRLACSTCSASRSVSEDEPFDPVAANEAPLLVASETGQASGAPVAVVPPSWISQGRVKAARRSAAPLIEAGPDRPVEPWCRSEANETGGRPRPVLARSPPQSPLGLPESAPIPRNGPGSQCVDEPRSTAPQPARPSSNSATAR